MEGENKVRLFKMVRLVMGNIMSPSLSGVSLCETVKMDDNTKKYPAAHKAITEDSHVDNVFAKKKLIKLSMSWLREDSHLNHLFFLVQKLQTFKLELRSVVQLE